MTETHAVKVPPAEHLAQHRITRHLKSLGVTDAQLDGVGFRQAGSAFRDWTVYARNGWPIELDHEMRLWCALRWLILDDPPPTPDRRDAWTLVDSFFESALRRQREAQDNAKKSVQKRREKADPVARLIEQALAQKIEPKNIAKDPAIFPECVRKVSEKTAEKDFKARLQRVYRVRKGLIDTSG